MLAAALLVGATGFLIPVDAAETIAEERVAIKNFKEELDKLIKQVDQGELDPKQLRKRIIKVKQPLKMISDNVNGKLRQDIFKVLNKAKMCSSRGDLVCAERHLEEARKLADGLRVAG